MRRWWFFTVERLQIKRGERRVIGVLLVLLAVSALFRYLYEPQPAYDETSYQAFEAALAKRQAAWERDRKQKLKRYFPSTDSLLDSAQTKEMESSGQAVRKSKQSTALSDSTEHSRLPLNTATRSQLEQLPGIGPVIAGRMVDWRNQHGGYSTISELQKVKGIGPKRLEDIRPLVRIDSAKAGK